MTLTRRDVPISDFSDLLELSQAIIYEAEAEDLRLTFIRGPVERLLGRSPESCLEDPNFWHAVIHPEDYARIYGECRAALAQGQSHVSQFRVLAKSGQVRWVSHYLSVSAGQAAGA